MNIFDLKKNSKLGKIFHSLEFCLQAELRDCDSVLDLGCGPSSPLQNCQNIKYSVGVEPFGPYRERSRQLGIHSEYADARVQDLEFPDQSFDAVIIIEVLEHLSESEGENLLERAQRWAKKKVVLTTPNGFFPQQAVDGNGMQAHLSGWGVDALRQRGFHVSGLAGFKFFRGVSGSETMGDDLAVSIRFRPKLFWFLIAAVSQLAAYYLPGKAFGLFAVKKLEHESDNI